jgi:Fe-S-cluster containining protein
MSTHYQSYKETRQQYQHLFIQLEKVLTQQLENLRGESHCLQCHAGTVKELARTSSHQGCVDNPWRKAALSLVEEELPADVIGKLSFIQVARNQVTCHSCSECCRLASSEYSFSELQERAQMGDSFAQEFIKIFLPYASREVAIERFPQQVEAVLAHIGEEAGQEKVHFYHCPYIQEDNLCGVYGTDKRPSICESYPETPLGYVSKNCAWKPWQEEHHMETLLAHAMLNLCDMWSQNIRNSIMS